jgi:hypothetical protein
MKNNDTLHTQEPRFVESHICQNRADMGHPSVVTDSEAKAVKRAAIYGTAEAVPFVGLSLPRSSSEKI